jgi:hypothetical protein
VLPDGVIFFLRLQKPQAWTVVWFVFVSCLQITSTYLSNRNSVVSYKTVWLVDIILYLSMWVKYRPGFSRVIHRFVAEQGI